MQKILIGLDIALIVIDLFLYIRFRNILKEHTQEDTFIVPTKMILPYVIAMAGISVCIPVIGILMQIL